MVSGPQDLQTVCKHFPSARRQPASGFEGEQQQPHLGCKLFDNFKIRLKHNVHNTVPIDMRLQLNSQKMSFLNNNS